MSVDNEVLTSEDRLSLDEVHGLLASRRRRYVLYCLYLYVNPIQVSDVAEQVAEWTHSGSSGELTVERSRLYVSLYHVDVPKLAEVDAVSYSRSEDTVELADNASQLRPYLERAAETDLQECKTQSL